jgi:hypothetical protein
MIHLEATYDKVNPEIQEVLGVQVLASSQPIGAECHPATVQLSGAQNDDPVMPCRITLDDLVGTINAHRPCTKDSKEFEGDKSGVGETPAKICSAVFLP